MLSGIVMLFRLAADLLVLIHLAFIVFVMLGGLLVLKWHWLSLLHLPTVIWGAVIEYRGGICPLTPWENNLRRLAGQEGYAEGFIEHYILPIIYPPGLTRDIQLTLAIIVIAVNLLVYGWLLWRMYRH
jgi:hypothetical protein